MPTINEIQQEVIEEFSLYDDWMDRYNYLIEMAKDLPALAPEHKVEQNLIKGCQSNVWLWAEERDGRVYFMADSDAIITRGIVALLVRVLSGHPATDIVNVDLFFIDQIGLKQNLSPTRSNGLLSMVKNMKLYALAIQEKSKM